MNFSVLVPARLASTRLPGKPLAEIGGLPMIVRVARNAKRSAASRVVVAADHEDIVGRGPRSLLNRGLAALDGLALDFHGLDRDPPRGQARGGEQPKEDETEQGAGRGKDQEVASVHSAGASI